MVNIILSEFYKILRSKVLYVISIVLLIMNSIACLVTSEYTNGSIRQIARHGISRLKLVLGQYIALSSVIAIVFISFGVINLLFDSILFNLGHFNIVEFVRMNLGIICMIFGVSGIGVFFSHLFKNGGIAIAVSILLILCNSMIINLLALITKNNIFINYTLGNMHDIIIDFTSNTLDIMTYSFIFLLIGIITILSSCVLFSKRDIG